MLYLVMTLLLNFNPIQGLVPAIDTFPPKNMKTLIINFGSTIMMIVTETFLRDLWN